MGFFLAWLHRIVLGLEKMPFNIHPQAPPLPNLHYRERDFLELSHQMKQSHGLPSTWQFVSDYGVSPTLCTVIWANLELHNNNLQVGFGPFQLLWALYYLKIYPSWDNAAGAAHVSKENYEVKVVRMIKLLASLDLVSRNNSVKMYVCFKISVVVCLQFTRLSGKTGCPVLDSMWQIWLLWHRLMG
jgi:hypothetical protein